jgi:putative transposase
MPLKRRKIIRLKKEVYSNNNLIFSITICTKNRQPIFRNELYAQAIIKTFQTRPFHQNAKLYAYCLMPDHLHLLISPKDGNLIDFIRRWKSYVASILNKLDFNGACWQRSFYDHALRKDEDIQIAAKYIVHNPVRKQITDKWREYPFSWHKWM